MGGLDLSRMSAADKAILAELLMQREKVVSENPQELYKPYPKQLDFHNATEREKMLMAGNQQGKTYSAAMECAYHATGLYPDWWEGRKYDHPTVGWAASTTSQGTRDAVQRLLLGDMGQPGTGAIPKDRIVEVKKSPHGMPGSVETILIRHKSGGISRITLKSYEQGREKWQGETLHYCWLDEEPGESIYFEALSRTNATKGHVFMTFTPLLGLSSVVKRFMIDEAPGTKLVRMGIEDALHYSPEEREMIINSYPAHEREARAHGIPIFGSGRVFPVAEEIVRYDAMAIPSYFKRICAIDFGWDHPFAAVWGAVDTEADVIYIYDAYRVREQTPVIHAAAMRPRGAWIPIAWPADGLQHDKGSGESLMKLYKEQGLAMMSQKATFPDGTNSVEAGILEMVDRFQTGRLKVAAHLSPWWDEYRLYHRKDGKLVKEGEDLMSATRYLVMMARYAAHPPSAFRTHPAQFLDPGVLDAVVGY
jgi:phage terminase large subunit-like protein